MLLPLLQAAAAPWNTTNGKFNRFSQTAMVTPGISGFRNKDALQVRLSIASEFCVRWSQHGVNSAVSEAAAVATISSGSLQDTAHVMKPCHPATTTAAQPAVQS